MRNINLMILYTLREALARKVFIIFFSLCLLGLILFALIFSFADFNLESISMGEDSTEDIRGIISMIFAFSFSMIGVWTIIIAIFSSAGFIPDMLQKGNIDLLLSKPIRRDEIILGKFLGVIAFIMINLTFLFLGIWFIVSFKFGIWDFNFLWVILLIPFVFSLLYSIIMFFGIITQNSIIGMMIAYFVFIILSPLLAAYKSVSQGNIDMDSPFYQAIKTVTENGIADTLIMGLYYIVPKTSDLLSTVTPALLMGDKIDPEPLISSVLFLIVMLGWSMYIFRRKDF